MQSFTVKSVWSDSLISADSLVPYLEENWSSEFIIHLCWSWSVWFENQRQWFEAVQFWHSGFYLWGVTVVQSGGRLLCQKEKKNEEVIVLILL